MKKKAGAPLGNHNAYKHGFYSAAFKAEERRLLEQVPLTDLAAEIELVRVTSYRFIEALNSAAEPLDIETQLAALRAVNLSAHSIVSMLRVQTLTVAATHAADALSNSLMAPEPLDERASSPHRPHQADDGLVPGERSIVSPTSLDQALPESSRKAASSCDCASRACMAREK